MTINSTVLDPWLEVVWERNGTDLLLTDSSPPRIRVDGVLEPVPGEPILNADDIEDLVRGLLDPRLLEHFDSNQDVDFSFSWLDKARIRGNAYLQRGGMALALRIIPSKIPSFDDLGLPQSVRQLVHLPRGLVLVTGPTGSGKSTTLASLIDQINQHRALHVLTVEDPVEYVHRHKRSAVDQREVGIDTPSFQRALRSALREDPDVLLIGEMRDLESIQVALTMAETGHVVFATLHTNDAPQAIDRIIDVFPAERQEQIRVQLAASLAAVVAQRLIPRTDSGLIAVFEVLLANNPTKNLIREAKTNQLRNVMTTHQQEGMRTLETGLAELIDSGTITYETALSVAGYPKELRRESRLMSQGAR